MFRIFTFKGGGGGEGGGVIILRTYAEGGGVNEKHTGAYKGGRRGPKLAILLRTYFMDAP